MSWAYKTLRLIDDNMGLLPDNKKCGLGMRRECRERFPPIKETAS